MEEVKLSDQDRLKERIKLRTELMRISAIGTISVGGGTIGLIVDGPTTAVGYLFIAGGLVRSSIVLLGGVHTYFKIRKQILEDGKVL